jgi:hypothetical protein
LNREAWATESGLLDSFDYTIEDAWFGPEPDSDYPDVIYLHMRGPAVIDGEIVDEEYKVRFSTGKNWEVIDGGGGVESATGTIKFHERSGMGELVDKVIDLIDEYPDLEAILADRGNPVEAATWEGLSFHFERVEHSYTDRETEEERTYSRLVPTSHLGSGGEKKTPAKKAPAKKPAAKKGSGDAAMKRAVKKFAKDFEEDEFGEFVDAVLDPDEFDQAEEIPADVKEWILDEDEGLWAELYGEE